MSIGKRHWTLALVGAALMHMLIVSVFFRPTPVSHSPAEHTLEISLGQLAVPDETPQKKPSTGSDPRSAKQPPTARTEKNAQQTLPPKTSNTKLEQRPKRVEEQLVSTTPLPVSRKSAPLRREAAPKPQTTESSVSKDAATEREEASDRAITQKSALAPEHADTGKRRTEGEIDPSSRPGEKLAQERDATAGSADDTSGNLNKGSERRTANSDSSAYYKSISNWLERHKRYPKGAIKRRQQGTVRLTFTIDRAGNLISQRVATSSGHPLLDREAKAMLRRAAPMPALPKEFPEDVLEISLPIKFALR